MNKNLEHSFYFLKDKLAKYKILISPSLFERLIELTKKVEASRDTVDNFSAVLSASSKEELRDSLLRHIDWLKTIDSDIKSLDEVVYKLALLINIPKKSPIPSYPATQKAIPVVTIPIKLFTCFLSTLENNIVTLEEGYLNIRDFQLNIVKSFYLFEGGRPYCIFEKNSHKELVIIYEGEWPKSTPYLVHVSLDDGSYSVISSPLLYIIKPLYWWVNDELFLGADKGNMVIVNLKKRSAKKAKAEDNPTFYRAISMIRELPIRVKWADSSRLLFTFLDKWERKAGLVDIAQQKKRSIYLNNPAYDIDDLYNVIYHKPRWLLIGEHNIYFQTTQQRWGHLEAPPFWVFAKVVFCPKAPNRFIVLRCEEVIKLESSDKEGYLTLYEIE